jgi:hypothetical protein
MKIQINRHSGECRNPETVRSEAVKPTGSIPIIRSGFRVKPGMTAKSHFMIEDDHPLIMTVYEAVNDYLPYSPVS